MRKDIKLYFVITALVGLALGLSDTVFSNYFKEVYNIDAFQRGLIEFPRELPGMLCMFIIMSLSALGDIRNAIIAQILCAVGMLVLGLYTPGLWGMFAFLFIYSAGMHMYMPLGDSIGLSLAEGSNVGLLMGRFNGFKTAFAMVAGIMVFIGFKTGIFNFETPILIFLISAVCFLAAGILLLPLLKSAPAKPSDTSAHKLVFRKQYSNYYILCMLFGVRKQIMFVYSPWVLIELLDFKADTMALLAVVGSLIGIFFMPIVGRWIDRYGVRLVMMLEAFAFIIVYIFYGYLSAMLSNQTLVISGAMLAWVFLLNIIDKMTAQFAMVRSIYMREIAVVQTDVTPSLALGLSLDHVVSIAGSAICGWIWYQFGPQYVFVLAGAVSAFNLLVAWNIKPAGTQS